MLYKKHLNTNFMQSSFILYAENIDQRKGGAERMERVKLFSGSFENEEKMTFHLGYFLLIRSAEQGQTFGVAVQKTDASDIAEEEAAEGLFEDREAAETFLFRLAEGLAMPVELLALCDDYISEREFPEKQKIEQAAS